jgi:hypothetical protein
MIDAHHAIGADDGVAVAAVSTRRADAGDNLDFRLELNLQHLLFRACVPDVDRVIGTSGDINGVIDAIVHLENDIAVQRDDRDSTGFASGSPRADQTSIPVDNKTSGVPNRNLPFNFSRANWIDENAIVFTVADI